MCFQGCFFGCTSRAVSRYTHAGVLAGVLAARKQAGLGLTSELRQAIWIEIEDGNLSSSPICHFPLFENKPNVSAPKTTCTVTHHP